MKLKNQDTCTDRQDVYNCVYKKEKQRSYQCSYLRRKNNAVNPKNGQPLPNKNRNFGKYESELKMQLPAHQSILQDFFFQIQSIFSKHFSVNVSNVFGSLAYIVDEETLFYCRIRYMQNSYNQKKAEDIHVFCRWY